MTPFSITDSYSLIQICEQIKLPATFLSNIFFPTKDFTMSDIFPVEFIKKHRRLAPFLVKGSRGVNMSRERSKVNLYAAPMIGAKRVIGLADISKRMLGELPIYSTMTPEDRYAKLQADDLKDLKRMLINRREAMASELLTTGQLKVRGFADDGSIVDEDTITFDDDWQVSPQKAWSDPTATIYSDLKTMCDDIAESAGELPDVLIISPNVESYLLNNTELKSWLSMLSNANLHMLNFAPHYTSPQSRFIGSISSLGLEVYSYGSTYTDDITGTVKKFLPDNFVLIGKAGSGKMLYGRVDIQKQGQWSSYAAEEVPFYSFNDEAQSSSLTVFSRCLPILPVLDSIKCLKVVP